MNKVFLLLAIILSLAFTAPQQDLVDKASYTTFKIPYSGDVYSGYLPIDKDSAFHYQFYPSQDTLERPQVALWLNGGPGCSSLQGAYAENGPFVFKTGTTEWMVNPYSWTKFAHMLYLETPGGVGFSYGNTTTNDSQVAKNNLEALVQFYIKFKEYQQLPLFFTGESYAGIYIPTLAWEVVQYNLAPYNPEVPRIPLEGIAVGNGCTDPSECGVVQKKFPIHKFDYLAQHNFISHAMYADIQAHREECTNKETPFCLNLTAAAYGQVNNNDKILWNPYNSYGYCFNQTLIIEGEEIVRFNPMIAEENAIHEAINLAPCSDSLGLYTYLRNKTFMDTLHISNKSGQWNECSALNYTKAEEASYYLYPKLIKAGVRILIFSGDIDAQVPITGTLWWLNKLQAEQNLATLKAWRPWFKDGSRGADDKQNAGNVWVLDGITFASVRDAGHMVPTDQRQSAYVLISSFFSGKDLPTL